MERYLGGGGYKKGDQDIGIQFLHSPDVGQIHSLSDGDHIDFHVHVLHGYEGLGLEGSCERIRVRDKQGLG